VEVDTRSRQDIAEWRMNMNNQNINGASRPKQIAPNAFVVGSSKIKVDRQHAMDWCQVAITGDCVDLRSGCGRPGVITETGDAILVCARGADMAVLESLEVGMEYRLWGRVVEKPGEWDGQPIIKRYFNLLPAANGMV